MSYEGLASRMSAAGCAINASALYKIEKGSPPRRITVDELVAFARVFETDLEDLVSSLDTRLDARAEQLIDLVEHAHSSLLLLGDTFARALRELAKFVVDHPSQGVALMESVHPSQPFSVQTMIDELNNPVGPSAELGDHELVQALEALARRG